MDKKLPLISNSAPFLKSYLYIEKYKPNLQCGCSSYEFPHNLLLFHKFNTYCYEHTERFPRTRSRSLDLQRQINFHK